MKNLKLVFLLLVGFLLFQSCNDEDELNEPTLTGVWNENDVDVELTVNGSTLSVYLRFNADYTIQEALMYEDLYKAGIASEFAGKSIEFKADNSYVSKMSGKDDETGTWMTNSDNTTLTIVDAGTGNETEFNIISLTSNALVISNEENRKIDFNKDGKDETLLVKVRLSLSK